MAKKFDGISKVDAAAAPVTPPKVAKNAPVPAPNTPPAEGNPPAAPVAEAATEAPSTPGTEPMKSETPVAPTQPEPPKEEVKVEEKTAAPAVVAAEQPATPPANPTPAVGEPSAEAASTQGTSTTPGAPDTYDTLFPEPTVVISGPPTWMWWVFLAIGSIAIGVLGYGLASGQLAQRLGVATTPNPTPQATIAPTASTDTTTPEPSPSESPTASASPSPTTSATPSSSLTIRVLNGTSTVGLADKTRTTLKDAGYTVRTIGNAKNSYTETMVYYAKGYKAQAEAVASVVGKNITVSESDTLASPDNVLIVVAK